MATDNIEKLYQNYGVLAEAKDKIAEHEKEYLEILAAVKGSDKEKRLASQFIAKFFTSFPNLTEQAIEAQFDLCEDDDVAIRKQAIKDLPSMCKNNKEHTNRIADILAQLLQSEDTTEINVVTNSLLAIMKSDPKGTLTGLFSQIQQSTDSEVPNEVVRERCIKFLAAKVKQLDRDTIDKECEDLIISEGKKVLQDSVADELEHVMDLLMWSKLGKTPAGKKELTQLIAALAFTEGDWHPEDPEYVDRLIQCSQHALPLFSALVDSTQFVNIFCNHVLPKWDSISENSSGSDIKLELLKTFSEITEHCGELDNAQEKINTIYDVLMKYLPEAPVENKEELTKKENDGENQPQDTKLTTPSLQFSHVECALFALHSLCRKAPEALGADTSKLKALRLRLQYTASLTQGYIKKLKEVTKDKTNEDSEETKLKIAALKTTSNINTLIRDIFRTPPSFKSKVQLSFQSKKVEKEVPSFNESKQKDRETTGSKRHRPITFDNDAQNEGPEKRSRSGDKNLKMYTPPSGKYSSRLNNSGGRFSGSNYVRGRGGYGRKDFRNNGAQFRRRNNY